MTKKKEKKIEQRLTGVLRVTLMTNEEIMMGECESGLQKETSPCYVLGEKRAFPVGRGTIPLDVYRALEDSADSEIPVTFISGKGRNGIYARDIKLAIFS